MDHDAGVFETRAANGLSVSSKDIDSFAAEVRRDGASDVSAFWSADSPGAQGGDVGYVISTTAVLPTEGRARLVEDMRARTSGGVPVVWSPLVTLDEMLAAALDVPRESFVFAMRIGDRLGICLLHRDAPFAPQVGDSASFAAAYRFLTTWHAQQAPAAPPSRSAFAARFTKREVDVLNWCAEGKTNWEIGQILGLSENTIRFHLKNVFRKLDATSRSGAISAALSAGVISGGESQRKALISNLYRSFIEGDVRPLQEMLADDVILVATAPPDLFAHGGRYEGPDGVMQHAALVARDYDARSFAPRIMVEDGDQVAVYLDIELVDRKTSQLMLFDCAHFFTFRANKLIHYVELFNTAVASKQRSHSPDDVRGSGGGAIAS
ncbi:LuxR C-terminal-related transcriptional regulator [Roseobacter sp. A03A-229]